MIIENLHANVDHARQVIRHVVPAIPLDGTCHCHNALANAIVSDRDAVPAGTLEKLRPIVGRYFE
jgi:hypothetical protein